MKMRAGKNLEFKFIEIGIPLSFCFSLFVIKSYKVSVKSLNEKSLFIRGFLSDPAGAPRLRFATLKLLIYVGINFSPQFK
jgi:hypothetical protein